MSTIQLWDWRRRVADLYATVRAAPDPEAAWTLWRQTRDTLYLDHPESPLEPDARAARDPLPFQPYDPAYRFLVSIEPIDAPPLTLPAGVDGEVLLSPFGRTNGLQAAMGAELTAYWMEGYCGGVFLPFSDLTTGKQTYGGGRYLLDTIKSADLGQSPDGRTVLDFNFAYNPSCAYSPRYICPLSPPSNRLPTAIIAGEQAR